MNFRLKKRFRGGGLLSIVQRLWEITTAYGPTKKKFVKKLYEYNSILRRHNAYASITVTASVIPRHPEVFRKLEEEGVELLVHGFRHIDYATSSAEKQENDIRKAVSVFNEYGLQFTGFRAPYSSYSGETHGILGKYFKYDSSEKFLWDCTPGIPCGRDSSRHIAVPYMKEGIIEIPVSLPSDIWLLHRFGVTHQKKIYRLLEKALDLSYVSGAVFTLQLHPENILKCDKALDELLGYAARKHPGIWVARLGEVADWWVERRGYSFHLEGGQNPKIRCECSDKATILVKNLDVRGSKPWFGGYRTLDEKTFSVNKNPAVGVSLKASEKLKGFLVDEGFIVEESTRKGGYGMYFDDEEFTEEDKLKILESIESSGKPHVRLWRWPDKARSVLSLSGDIDCVTLWDYVLRANGR